MTTLEVSPQEHAWLIDGLLVLTHQMRQIPENDLSELPEMQALLERLMGLARPEPGSWIPADPDGLPPKTFPRWRKDEMARRGTA